MASQLCGARTQAKFFTSRHPTSGRPAVAPVARCQALQPSHESAPLARRQLLQSTLALTAASLLASPMALAAGLPEQEVKRICDAECSAKLESAELKSTASGLQYRDLVEGKGPQPPTGFQVVCNYVAMTPNLRVFDSSLEKGAPYDIRVGSGNVIPGLDEGIRTMRPGGIRRLYIPGPLAFPKGLKAAAGRPSVPAASPVVFDVQLLYIPGLEADDEY